MTKISAKRREESATVHVGKKAKFPVDSAQTAKSAARLIPNAKPALSSSQKASVMSEVHKYLPNAEAAGSKKKKKGS